MRYGFDDLYKFEEKLFFGKPYKPLSEEELGVFRHCLHFLHIAAGISYYKAFMPQTISVENFVLDRDSALFFNDFYRHGLGEFAYRNTLDIGEYHFFNGDGDVVSSTHHCTLPRKSAVLVGGGKDSLVSVEALRLSGEPVTLFAVNPAQPIRDCIAASGLPSVTVGRTLDPLLFELNRQGAYNGHVPITGIIGFIAAAAAIWHGFDTIILSNERSANEETVDGVNHQYSKSFAYEKDFAELLQQKLLPNLSYFSFLRPLSELAIARVFAKMERYDGVFTSCNKAFSLTRTAESRWCGACPKCLFVFMALATAMDQDRLVRIFGRNLFDAADLIPGYRELSGLSGHKPWECVGEIMESAAALYHLSRRDGWKECAVLQTLGPELESKYGANRLTQHFDEAMMFSAEHRLSPPYEESLKHYAA